MGANKNFHSKRTGSTIKMGYLGSRVIRRSTRKHFLQKIRTAKIMRQTLRQYLKNLNCKFDRKKNKYVIPKATKPSERRVPMDMAEYLGTDAKPRIFKRPRGITARTGIWIDRNREVIPIKAMTVSHLFFVLRTLEKWANNNRYTIQREVEAALKAGDHGKVKFFLKVDQAEDITPDKARDLLNELFRTSMDILARRWFPVYSEIEELIHQAGYKGSGDSRLAMFARQEIQRLDKMNFRPKRW